VDENTLSLNFLNDCQFRKFQSCKARSAKRRCLLAYLSAPY